VNTSSNTVVIKVQPMAAHLTLLRAAVGGVAARDQFTLDQVNDLQLAVEEAASQLLSHIPRGPIEMTIFPTSAGMAIRVAAEIDVSGKVIDESSPSWRILQALTDEVRVESQQSGTGVVLIAHRLLPPQDAE
jgi:serine/threonine-protein kinase RsbW